MGLIAVIGYVLSGAICETICRKTPIFYYLATEIRICHLVSIVISGDQTLPYL